MIWDAYHPAWLGLLVGSVLAMGPWIRARRIRRVRDYLESHPGPEFWPTRVESPHLPGRWPIRGALTALAGLTLALALHGVPLGTRYVPKLVAPRPVVLVLDISRSMAVTDVPFGRLAAARLLARRAISRLPSNPIGLLVFAGESHLLVPPTLDRDLLFRYLDGVGAEMLTDQGTALAGALQEGLRLLEDGEGGGPYAFLLLTDGEDHGDPEESLRVAGEINTMGGELAVLSVGTSEGGVVPGLGGAGLHLMSGAFPAETENGMPRSRARPAFLSSLAEAGGGPFAPGSDGAATGALLARVGEWGESGDGVVLEEAVVEGWPWFLGVAVAALFAELLLGLPERRKEAKWS